MSSTTFIPAFHFVPAADKLKLPFQLDVINYHYYSAHNVNLLEGKDIHEIDEWSSGKINMNRYKRMFKSISKAMGNSATPTGMLNEQVIKSADMTGLSWEPLPLIPQKLNSAISSVNKIPIEITVTAKDGLAMKKKKEDIEFLKNKPKIQADLQDFADQLQIEEVDLGSTKHGDRKYSSAPLGLDLGDPDQEEVFSKLIYSLGVEKANEKALQQFYDIKRAHNVKLLEIWDNFKFGICTNRAFPSSMTGLPDLEYVFPGDIDTPRTRLPDYSDNTHRIYNKEMTVLEMFNNFSDEIKDQNVLNEIINGDDGYCACNKRSKVGKHDFNTFKLRFKLIEIRSVDRIGIKNKPGSKRGVRTFTTNMEEADSQIWAQNTYGFWWLVNTKMCFGAYVLNGAHRTKGHESYQNFSTNIYKSQPKSAVELSIGENKKAQIADIKMEFALLKSLPAGQYIDLRYMRSALSALTTEDDEKSGAQPWTMARLLALKFEENIMIGDSQGFDGKNDGQLKPFIDIPGGLKTEVAGYIEVILNAARNISSYTGINEQLTGQSPNPEMLVGMQKLLINAGQNSIYYCNEAIQSQYTSVFNLWASYIQAAIEKGGMTREAIVNMIGDDDTDLLDSLDETPLHNLTAKISVGQRELERQMILVEIDRQKKQGSFNAADEYMLMGIDNPKEKFAFLAITEMKWQRKQDKIRQEQFANQQQLVAQQGQNMIQVKGAETEGRIKEIYAKGDVQSKLLPLISQLGVSEKQADAIVKLALQRDRNIAQKDKAVSTIREKQNMEAQEAL